MNIHIAIDYISSKKSEEKIKTSLRNLKDVPLDNHLRHIINLYLSKKIFIIIHNKNYDLKLN